MKRQDGFGRALRFISGYLLFFLTVAFAVTCCTMLFLSLMANELGVELSAENIGGAAKFTFLNVVLISLLFTVIDAVRRRRTVERPTRRIVEATEQIMQGDLSVRISPASMKGAADGLPEIAEHVNKMAEELSGIETLRTDFIANVSHEIKTPLAVIRNYCALLDDPKLSPDERREYTQTVSNAAQKLSGLISNILRLNKLENQQIYPQLSPYNLSEQLCECLLSFEERWEKKSLLIETDIAEDVYVMGDAEMMTLVWNNLFSNAIKFTDAGGTVKVTLSCAGEWATVKVADSGCGISREVGAHMFEKFYQGDTSHATEGNGLGLTLVKRVIDITESEIAVESTLGVGTTFTVKIRRHENELEETR
ncbi:MAG: HAMP domain-containing histidine kinase [Clostridia bacterium]|nr:HAMP domain-containing histidine kinase [Clostridia bacterium]MBQ9785689.1 HAMP domain-containing histidine kinase [Clostridia bacterium]